MELANRLDNEDRLIDQDVERAGIRLRTYQAEMLEASLRENIIVAQDTGSGKTHIALARTAAELETCDPNQLVWFLAPTVALCEQQFKVFKSILPAYETQLLTGNDNVDHWTDQRTWDAVLANVRIVLSTHKVLLDALTHGFVQMSKLALLIFDEAHHCTGNHPANVLLADFYLPRLQEGVYLPKILGLSASPVMKAKASDEALEVIERNMNAITKTPKMHRSELLRFVHKPQLIRMSYSPTVDMDSPLYAELNSQLMSYDLRSDPYVLDLLNNPNKYHNSTKKLEEATFKQATYCFKELKTLVDKHKTTAAELGVSVADWCLQQCIARFTKQIRFSDQLLDLSHAETEYLQKVFSGLPLPTGYASRPMSLDKLSPKVESLVDLLASEADSNLTGLIFVEQRAWVAALAEIISVHPKLQGRLNVGTFVGSSMNSKRKSSIAAMIEPKNQQDTLDKLKGGDINLIIATTVLEEGIDVSACHLVICFESPKNLKSFVQRRGRARRMESKYIIFSPGGVGDRAPATWERLEQEMRNAYENDLRRVKIAEQREMVQEVGERFYRVASTGALLTLDNAIPHLYHFCALLSSDPYVDTRPQFGFKHDGGNIAAEVTLPLAVDPTLRVVRSLKTWLTERMAAKDVAFEAYKMLHDNGLVNDNLLPVREEEDAVTAEFQKSDKTASMIEVPPTLDPWHHVATYQMQEPYRYHRTQLVFHGIQEQPFYMTFYLPVQLPAVPDLTLFWNESKRITVRSHRIQEVTLSDKDLMVMRHITRKILNLAHGTRIDQSRYDFLWLLLPSDASQSSWDHDTLVKWDADTNGVEPASHLISCGMTDLSRWGHVKVQGDEQKWLPRSIDMNLVEFPSGQTPKLRVSRVPKRRDFLYPVPKGQRANEAYTKTEEFLASECLVEMLPFAYSACAMLMPAILYRYEMYMTTDALRLGLLAPLTFHEVDHLPLLVQALTASSTGDISHYQRLEFFGDCIVKFIASVHLMASHPKKPESFLTGRKGKIVSNGFFARATLASGLDKFIIRKRFTGAKWRPRYAADVLCDTTTPALSKISSKSLADVIESLVGASYLIGGFSKAVTCMQTLLPLEPWTSVPDSTHILHDAVPASVSITSLTTLETLIGYTFTKKLALLEALTHASYKGPLENCSYERLEFLGDAVLDYIISRRLYAHTPALGHAKMHGVRTAMANAAFLAFSMFETTVAEDRTIPPDMHREVRYRCLWQFLRSDAAPLLAMRDAALAQYDAAKDAIRHALHCDAVFPWHILALTDSPKFLSDIVESVLGAIYVDSAGDMAACEVFVGKLGILGVLERILRDGVDCLHPKERLGILAVDRGVQYVAVRVNEAAGGAGRKYGCQVRVGGVDVGGVVEGVKRLNAETVAAWEAYGDGDGDGDGDLEMKEGVEDGSGDEEWFDAEEGGVELGGE
ncbi:P-loop containing nucleoside triphosphate hydrolase protein [Karstenula rhodostoma CBS 690.94]|uniref:P-loop containing nucleoside triphosphate hydrolase protein n=1 Tax=Karstenula rhodostoma CBS 690.94 TaxID=1392251 RepID=A0A9P4PPF5_9PLEO|nr:P-loop containing nucleoside triphosphate hydrolase protein [Karstenula rhodostoma CBS 690.94]